MVENPQGSGLHVGWNAMTFRCSDNHVLQPISAIRHLLGNPGWFTIFHPPEPIGPETQYRAKEGIFTGSIVDDEADVNDVAGERVGRRIRSARGWLHKFDLVAFRVADIEPLAAITALSSAAAIGH